MTVGTVLKQAREQAGLSAGQISEHIKIQLYKIKALEEDDFSRLPEGIYLDGIVRAYSREVGLNPEAMVARARIERGKGPGDWEVPFSEPIDLRSPSRPNDARSVGVPEPDGLIGSFVTERQTPAAPAERAAQPSPAIAPAPAARPEDRRGRFVIALLALFAAAFAGAYLYESNRVLERNETAASTPPPATDVEIATPETEPRPSVDGTDAPPSAASQDVTTPSATAHPESPRDRSAASGASTARPGNVATSGSFPNVAGSWTLKTQVESSSYSRYAGLQLGYEIRLEQKGDRVTGSGRKITENGTDVDPPGQTPLTLNGTVSGDRLTLNFVERGARRPARGKFVMILDETGRLRGRFSSTAAKSSGLVEADRASTP